MMQQTITMTCRRKPTFPIIFCLIGGVLANGKCPKQIPADICDSQCIKKLGQGECVPANFNTKAKCSGIAQDKCHGDCKYEYTMKRVVQGSANVINSLGNYYNCSKQYPNSDSAYTVCVYDVMDEQEHFEVVSQGLCVPNECHGNTTEMDTFMKWAICPGLLDQIIASCWMKTEPLASSSDQEWFNVSVKNLAEVFRPVLEHPNVKFHCSSDKRSEEYGPGAIVMIVLSCILVLLCSLSEYVEYTYQAKINKNVSISSPEARLLDGPDPDPSTWPFWRRVLKAFCPSDAFAALLERTPNRNLAGLDGMRSFSMIWIILAHTSLLVANLGTDDQGAVQEVYKSLPQQFTLGSSLAVDTFFFLSGLLTTYTLLRRMRKSRKTTFPGHKFVMLRYLRLTPLYAFILFFYTYLVPSVAKGPVWYRMYKESDLCFNYWWSNLIYINNFYPVAFHKTCMSWSWYLANDMQFFIVGLVILSIYLRVKWLGIALGTMLAITGVVSGWVLLVKHRNDVQDDYFDKPYTRATPFSVGLLLGIMFVDKELVNSTFSWAKSRTLMFFSVLTILTVVYVDFINFKHDWNDGLGSFSDMQNAAYQTIGRLGFALAISMVTLLCVTQHGGGVNWFLSLPMWEPLGKLTYGVYLVHPIVIRAYYYQKVQLFHFDVFEQTMYFISITILSYAIAMVLHVTVELPFANLTKLVIPARR
eukprot:m.38716 g.38716  ORF g.38716 m.38716 type:complete len:700 (+) comp9465_c0_seq1:95-2194(+)